jgi:hypothetical protein
MKDLKNMHPIKTRHEKSSRIIYEFSCKMGVLNEKINELFLLYGIKIIMRYYIMKFFKSLFNFGKTKKHRTLKRTRKNRKTRNKRRRLRGG